MILYLYATLGDKLQQKDFLTGIGFLLATAITGIAYILLELTPYHSTENFKLSFTGILMAIFFSQGNSLERKVAFA